MRDLNSSSCSFFPPPKEKQTRVIRHFHFHGWPEVGIPAEGKGMIDIIASVQRQQQQSGDHPIVVHCRWLRGRLIHTVAQTAAFIYFFILNVSVLLCCSAGAGRTGTFIALSNILERVKAEGLLDVFQTVKSLRMQRPHMVQTVVSSLPVGRQGAVHLLPGELLTYLPRLILSSVGSNRAEWWSVLC